MGLFSAFTKENRSETNYTSTTDYKDSSANAGGAGSIAAGTGSTVTITNNDLSEKIASDALNATSWTATAALGANEAVAKEAIGGVAGVAYAGLGANESVSKAALGSNEATAKTAISETSAVSKYAMDANLKSLGFVTNTLLAVNERAAQESADNRVANAVTVAGANSLISTLQSQTGSALERAQAPEAASIKAILTPILWVVGVVLVAAFIFAGKSTSKTKDKQ